VAYSLLVVVQQALVAWSFAAGQSALVGHWIFGSTLLIVCVLLLYICALVRCYECRVRATNSCDAFKSAQAQAAWRLEELPLACQREPLFFPILDFLRDSRRSAHRPWSPAWLITLTAPFTVISWCCQTMAQLEKAKRPHSHIARMDGSCTRLF
jgi:hypothetical protein